MLFSREHKWQVFWLTPLQRLPTPHCAGTVAKDVETLNEITASGNAPDFHRIPYYFKPTTTDLKTTAAKVTQQNLESKIKITNIYHAPFYPGLHS